MAFSDGEWGYAYQALTDVAGIGYTDSEWGYTAGPTLVDPGTTVGFSDSNWGPAFVTLTAPHTPIGVMTATGIKHTRILTWTSTGFR